MDGLEEAKNTLKSILFIRIQIIYLGRFFLKDGHSIYDLLTAIFSGIMDQS